MSHRITESSWLAPEVRRLVVEAPHVVRHCGPGQFVIVRAAEGAERIPLTIADSDRERGTITLIIQAVGASTGSLCELGEGDSIQDVAGPLGRQTDLGMVQHAVLVGGGVGTAVVFPQARALKQLSTWVSAVIGGRSKPYVILEQELSAVCDSVYPCTDDGSHGFKGLVTDRLRFLIDRSILPVDLVICAGPVPMMRAVAELTRPMKIRTIASLNPIMVDGTGMCGGCRVHAEGGMKFACVDGPEFDAHQVDFKELADRLASYRGHEQLANERHVCQAESTEAHQ